MEDSLFDEQTFFGYRVQPRIFWITLTLMMVFFTSPMAHAPFFFGYSPWVGILSGAGALLINVLVPLLVAHRAYRKGEDHFPR